MLVSLIYDKKDPKFSLLKEIFKYIDNKSFLNICARNGIRNTKMMQSSVRILFTSFFFEYPLSKLIDEIDTQPSLRKFLSIKKNEFSAAQISEYLSRFKPQQFEKIVNSLLKRLNKPTMKS